MALSYGALGTSAYTASGGSVASAGYPSGITTDSALILIVGQKPATANSGTVTTPSGWTLQKGMDGSSPGDTGGYTTTLGADTGNTNLRVYTKNTVTGSESGTLNVTVGQNNVSWALIVRVQSDKTVRAWAFAADGGKDTSAGNVSIATAGGLDVTAGDLLIAAVCIPTDVTTPAQFSAEALSQTSTTFDAATEIAEPDSANGNDIGGLVFAARASSGGNTTAVTMSATAGGTTTNVRGPGIVLRIRAAVTYSNTLTDNLSLYDNNGKLLEYRLNANDAVLPADSATPTFISGSGTIYSRTATDAASLADSMLEFVVRLRVASDALSLTDSSQRVLQLSRALVDNLPIVDSLLAQKFFSRRTEDALLVTDGLLASRVLLRAATDSLIPTDGSLRSTFRVRMLSDVLSLNDELVANVIGGSVITATLTDFLALHDDGGTKRTWNVVATTALLPTDGESHSVAGGSSIITKTQTDNLNITDDGVTKEFTVTAEESFVLTDSSIRSALRQRVATDNALPTDSLQRVFIRVRALTDAVNVVDSFIKTIISSGATYTNTLTDTVALTDSTLKLRQLARMLTDNVTPTDEVQRSLRLSRLISDSISVVDDFFKSISSSGVVSSITKTDTITVLDSTQRTVERNRLAQDNVLLVDGTSKTAIRMRALFDSVTISDGVITVRWYSRVLAEALGVSDELLATYVPYIQYHYDVRIKLDADPPPCVLYASPTGIELGADEGILFGGYN